MAVHVAMPVINIGDPSSYFYLSRAPFVTKIGSS